MRRYVAAQDDCVVVGTRMSLNLALADLRTDRQVAVAQEHNHLAKAPAVRASYVAGYPRLDALVVLTEGDAGRYRTLLGDGCRVDVVPNALPHGIPLRRSPLTATVAVSAGSLIKRKGFDLLVDAWRPVAAAHPEWRLRIYGVGDQADELTSLVEDAGLTGTVTLEGFEPDLARRLDEASLFVLPSRREGMPMVLLEAMAAGSSRGRLRLPDRTGRGARGRSQRRARAERRHAGPDRRHPSGRVRRSGSGLGSPTQPPHGCATSSRG